jgi:DNA polymerase-3 subunit delta'
VVIIDDVETLTEEAANALLKLIEEPPVKTVFFLMTEHEEILLPTIRSRGQLFRFTTVSDQDIEQALCERGSSSEYARQIARNARGTPGRAITEFLNGSADTVSADRISQFLKCSFYEQSLLVEEWLGKAGDTGLDADELDEMLESWTLLFYTHRLIETGYRDKITLLNRCREIECARALLRQNTNPRAVLEVLALRLGWC